MNPEYGCEKVLLVQAEFDGELDAAAAAALAAHRRDCTACQEATAELARARVLFNEDLYQPMPEHLRARILTQVSAAEPSRRPVAPGRTGFLNPSWWRHWRSSATGFSLGAACAAAIAFLMLAPRTDSLSEQIVAGHIRSLQPGHLEDVLSSDQHTVKPWFDGRIDFAPPVRNLATDGFPLKGGRLDYVGGRPVAALVYQHDKHIINLFVWPTASSSPTPPKASERQGYNIVHWTSGGMAFWAVSDLEPSQLSEFAKEWRQPP